MREKGKPWFPFTSEQHNFFEHPSRLFFMKARFKGLPTYGYHTYRATTAGMLIKLAGWIPVVDLKDPLLFPTETVTFLNDLACLRHRPCLMSALNGNPSMRFRPA